MTQMVALGLLLCVSSTASGAVLATVFLADGETPLELADPNVPYVYRDIMVGTKLTILVNSHVGENWTGKLHVEEAERDRGCVSTMDHNDVTATRHGSIFGAAGEDARVRRFENPSQAGVTMTAMGLVMAGDWFIFDYAATKVGNCRVKFSEVVGQFVVNSDPPYPKTEEILLQELVFSHVPTRDFNGDTKVDLVDFAIMAAFNGITNCTALNACEGADLDLDGDVDCDDWMLFADYWLERTQ